VCWQAAQKCVRLHGILGVEDDSGVGANFSFGVAAGVGEPFWAEALPRLQDYSMSACDTLASLTELTARSVVLNYQRHLRTPPERVVLAGGGAANPELARRLQAALREWRPELEVVDCQALGWPRQAIEPAAFAWLAWRRWRGLPGNLPETTGARRPVILGHWTEP
jgi:anhydro-N-acetylmuramic acid kinase